MILVYSQVHIRFTVHWLNALFSIVRHAIFDRVRLVSIERIGSLLFRQRLARTHNRHRRPVVLESLVNLLEALAHGLGVEEVHGQRDAEGDDAEEHEVVVADVGDGDGRRHDDDEVPKPVVRGRDGGHRDAELHGRHFGAVEEVGAEEADGDEEVELVPESLVSIWRARVEAGATYEEDEEDAGDSCRIVRTRVSGGDGQRQHATTHAGAAEHEQRPASVAIDGEEGDERAQKLPGQGASDEDAGQLSVQAQLLFEDDGCVDGDEVAPRHLLIELQQDAEAEAIEQLLGTHGEHVPHAGFLDRRLLERVLDAFDLLHDQNVVLGRVLEVAQDRSSFAHAVF